MAMRDLQQMERLSSAAALGFWADDVVIALGRRVASAATLSDRELIKKGAEILGEAVGQIESPLAVQPVESRRDLAATESALVVATAFAGAGPDLETQRLLAQTVKAMKEAAAGVELGPSQYADLERAMEIFASIGQRQLIKTNAVLRGAGDSLFDSWTATAQTSNFL